MRAPNLRSFHKWMGLILLLPFLVWTVTGLLFALKPGWGPAYEYLSPWSTPPKQPVRAMSLASFAATSAAEDAISIELQHSALGPLFKLENAPGSEGGTLFDATSGKRLDPLSIENAETLVLAGVAKSMDSSRYGSLKSHEAKGTDIEFVFSGGPHVTINLHTASLRQSGPDTERINWLYKLHYMQWTGNARLDRIVGFAFLVFVWLLAGAGVVLTWRVRRSKEAQPSKG